MQTSSAQNYERVRLEKGREGVYLIKISIGL